MKILVTGGAGFIGSNVVDEYLNLGHEVVIVDNLITGKKENINPKAKFIKFSITDKNLFKIFEEEKFDLVNHHAAQIDVRKAVEDPAFDANVNVIGLINVLQNCIKYKVKKVIYISSGGAIYSINAPMPADENTLAKPLSPYGITKLTGEHYLYFYNKVHGLKFTTLRYSNVYGIRQDPLGEAGVCAIFSNLMSKNKQPTIYGNGKQTRDYIFVKDVVQANVLSLKKGDNQAFNIGTGKETSVNELFNTMKEFTEYKNDPNYADARSGEVLRSCLNINKAKEILGFKPKFSLKEGLKQTIEWVKIINQNN
jgi:UDP-glucose 4-epimerase